MYYLIGFILLILARIFLIILANKQKTAAESAQEQEPRQVASNCCGVHEICEFDASIFDENEILYFNDEELDELRNIRKDQITGKQMDDLREVLYTLRTDEINIEPTPKRLKSVIGKNEAISCHWYFACQYCFPFSSSGLQ